VVRNVKLKELGERKIIKLAREILLNGSSDELKLEDDCAALEFGQDYLLITTDMISQRTHIPKNAKPWQIGWHLVAINLSDIASMGGVPLGVVVAVGLPSSFDEEFAKDMVEGANSCAQKYGISILGGDTKETDSLTLTGCAIGRVGKSEIMKRKGAEVDDIVCVTGALGKAAAAYYSLENNSDDLESIKDLLEVQPKISEGNILSQSGCVTSAMDISDGLASSLFQLSEINDVSYEIEFEKVPKSKKAIAISEKLGIPSEDLVLYFGGDYELLLTIKEKGFKEIKKALSELGTEFTQIGKVTENKKNILIKDGVSTSLKNKGFEHFRWNK
jgi:thiamine-monophosphate kinase